MTHVAPIVPGAAAAALKNFAASLLPFLVTVLTAFVIIPETAYAEPTTWLQLAGLVLSTAIALLVPLAPTAWRGLWKTGLSVVVAIVAAVLTFIVQGDFTIANVVLVIIAAISALATEIGVQVRTAPVPASQGADGAYDASGLPPFPRTE